MSKIYQVNKINQKFDYLLLILIIAMVLLGLFTIFSASAYVSEIIYKKSTYYFQKQFIYSIIGFTALIVGMRIDFYQIRSMIKPAMYFITVCLIATYIPALGGTVVNGANGWIRIPVINFGFQPSELAKVLLIIFAANILSNPEYNKLKFKDRLITLVPIAAMTGIVVFQPDIGNTSIISLSVFSVYFAAGLNIMRIVTACLMGGIALITLILSNPYQMARITGFMDPWQDPQGKGFQLIQSLMAIGSGGVSGKGLGQSVQKLFYLPESHTDFIFSVFCEETGLIGALLFLCLLFLISQRGFSIALRTKDHFIKLVATGITTMICGQASMNIGVATGVLPTTGITLPFISYGGTSIIVTLFCMGLLLNASKYSVNNWEVIEGKKEDA